MQTNKFINYPLTIKLFNETGLVRLYHDAHYVSEKETPESNFHNEGDCEIESVRASADISPEPSLEEEEGKYVNVTLHLTSHSLPRFVFFLFLFFFFISRELLKRFNYQNNLVGV